MNALGRETNVTATSIGLGMLLAIFGAFAAANFVWAVRLTRSMQRGEGTIGRWTVSPLEFEAFRTADRDRTLEGLDNDYRLPRNVPPSGFEVIFSEDAVLIGDFFYGLSSSGLARFRSAKLITGTPMLEFDTRMLYARSQPVVKVEDIAGVLRVPVSAAALDTAQNVVRHYIGVLERQIIVKPDFWPKRVRFGRRLAIVSAALAATGFLLNALKVDLGIVPLVLSVAGTIFAIGGLLIAVLAHLLDTDKKRKPG